MSYESPTDLEREMREASEKLQSELATFRCMIAGLYQHVKATGGQKALDAAIALALEEVKENNRGFEPKADAAMVPYIANGSVRR